ncbi:MAG: transcription antitermination factor NusB [Firmicutes bacterium]|nr:transcription antitermination factor NusB [Bacillota bacterium]
MKYKRSELRKKIMIILYQIDIFKEQKIQFEVENVIKDNLVLENEFVKDIVFGVTTYQEKIDELANKYMKNWTINRLDKSGSAILRMAIYEINYTDTPEIVVINEALELAKKYCDVDVRKIINAVLDRLIKA